MFLVTFIRTLAAELHETGVRLQVVCPGIVKTEFFARQGIDRSDMPGLAPEQVVDASLRGLLQGEVVCLPTVTDEALLARRDEAELAVLQSGASAQLAPRYLR